MEHQVVLGIDIGTSGTKAIAVAFDGTVIASSIEGYEMTTPAPGFAEQHPDDWWAATVAAVRKLLDDCPDIQVEAIGLSGQMHGLVPLDGEGRVVRPAIIWCDVRTEEQVRQLEERIGRDAIIRFTQNPPLPNFTLTKLLWMKKEEPHLYAKIAKVLLPKDYIRFRLTDAMAIDVTDASGTLLFDVAKRQWSQDMCNAAGIPNDLLPPTCESNEIVGHISQHVAQLLGLPSGIPVVAGAGDQAAGAIGLGVIQPGTISSVFGTSGVVLAATDSPLRDPLGRLHTFCHAQRDAWFVMGVTQAAGGSLQWYKNQFAQAEQLIAARTGADVYALLMDEASRISPGAEGLLFLPYLMGERTPHLNPAARGAWLGLQWRHGAAHLVRAVLEGVAFSLRDGWEIMRELGVASQDWKVSGGGAQGRVWMRIFASVIHRQVEIVRASHGPAYGAAILAAQGIGVLAPSPASLQAWLAGGEIVRPDARWAAFYEDLYPVFQSGYQATKALAADLHRLAAHAQ